MRIERGEERKEIDISISDIVQEGGRLNILPTVKKYFSIDYKPKNDKLTLVAGGFIGLIPINKNLAIDIRPKFAITNLARIVSIAEDNFNTLDFFSRKYRINENRSSVVIEFLAECLVNELQSLEAGILKQYILSKEISNKIRGRLNFSQSIMRLWSKGHFNKAAISFFDLTENNQFNQLIKFTIRHCIYELDAISSERKDIKNLLINFFSMFEKVDDVNFEPKLVGDISNQIKDEKIPALRGYYIEICEICKLIVEGKGISFDEVGADIELSSFTLDMAAIFEKYLINSLRAKRNVFPEGLTILDGNKEGKKRFYNQPSVDLADAKPDIIIKIGNTVKVIADVKYKNKSKEVDRYQVISHALSFGSSLAILILPNDDPASGVKLSKLGTVGQGFPIDVYEYLFNLSSDDLQSEELELSRTILQLIQQTQNMIQNPD